MGTVKTNNMKKTALQELIQDLESILTEDLLNGGQKTLGLREAIEKAKALLPKEREDLEEAYDEGWDNGYERGQRMDYYSINI